MPLFTQAKESKLLRGIVYLNVLWELKYLFWWCADLQLEVALEAERLQRLDLHKQYRELRLLHVNPL